MDPATEINKIISNHSIDQDDSSDKSRAEMIEELTTKYSWEKILDVLIDILSDDSRDADDYNVVAQVLWSAVLDKKSIPANKIIALLYHRLPPDQDSNESNLAWSITSKLKNVEYLSKYNPKEDSEIIKEAKNMGFDL